MFVLLLMSSLASPPRPAPSTPGPADCATASALDPGVLGCAAVAVPPSDVADLLADRAWALQLDAHLQVCEVELRRQHQAVPRAVVFGAGVAVGVGALVGGAWVAGRVH